MTRACRDCLTRAWLLGRLSGHLDVVRSRIGPLLALPDRELLDAVGGDERRLIEHERANLDVWQLGDAAGRQGVSMICRCDGGYPARLHDLDAPPAVIHVAGGLERFLALAARDPVAVVGSRRASGYGLEMARSLARDLAASGLTVVSGMARGIDTAAHQGDLDAGRSAGAGASIEAGTSTDAGTTIAVLPGPAQRPYPAGQRGVYRRVIAAGVAVSELPCGAAVRRWSFLARNRIIAGLSGLTVVVEASERSGALLTAQTSRDLARPIGAVPGRVTTAEATGANALLSEGAGVIRSAQDVLDRLYGVGAISACRDHRDPLTASQTRVLRGLEEGHGTAAALARAGVGPEAGLAMLSELELGGWVRRGPGGRFTVIP
jgi:DNA processing protein